MLLTRTLTALLLAPLAALVILLPPTGLFALIIAGVFAAAAWEWTRLCRMQHPLPRAAVVALMLALMGALWWWRESPVLWPMVSLLGVAWWLLSLRWLRGYSFAAAPGLENRILKLLAGAFAFIPAWVAAMTIHGMLPAGHWWGLPGGHWWTLLALVVVWAADTGAYFAGRFFGRRKLAPRISPGKTWAGAYGGVCAGALIAGLGGWALGRHGWLLAGLVGLGVITVAAAIVGDLFESLMKRHADIKDSGTLFPGHGGLLDRLDSVFAALPVFAVGLMLLHL